MADAARHEELIRLLAHDLRPVRPLAPPWLRALGWLAVVAASAAGLAAFADLGALGRRLAAAPDMALVVAGSVLTTLLAALAAFQVSVPGRRAAWALAPAPAAALWLGASGLGCLRAEPVLGTHAIPPAETAECLIFIIGVSLPLSALLLAMLRRARPLRPGLTAAMGGLAAAAAAATLLNFFHPFDATAIDLVAHVVAVALVVLGNRALGDRLLAGGAPRPAGTPRRP